MGKIRFILSGTLGFLLLLLISNSHQSDHLDGILKRQWKLVSTTYLKYNSTVKFLELMKQSFPENVDFYSIGKSVQGREMYIARLGNAVKKVRAKLVPKMKIVANMHGDETLGRVLNLMLIVDLVKGNRAKNKRIQRILKETEIHLLISMNPDGFETTKEGECSPDANKLGRANANLKDLNRDFPDQFRDAAQTSFEKLLKNRQPETQNVMKWIKYNDFVLSANLHALAVVASYPFDSVPPEIGNRPRYSGAGVISYSPDHDFFFHTATTYANTHKTMSHEKCNTDKFKNGVTNGAEWYNVQGGMQDFNYVHSNCFEITFELSCCKVVKTKDFLKEWDNNKEALYKFIEATHSGVKGVVSKNGKPVAFAKIHVEGIDHEVVTNKRGEYWRLLLPGKYRIWVSHGVEKSAPAWVTVQGNNPPKATVKNFSIIDKYKISKTGGGKGKGRTFQIASVHERKK